MIERVEDVEELESLLFIVGPTSVGWAARHMGFDVPYIRQLVQAHPEKFDMVGVTESVATWCIALADKERPIQFVLQDENTE